MKNILQMLEMSSKKYPNKIIFGDVKDEIKYAEFTKKAKIIGAQIASKYKKRKCPIVIFIDKTINCLSSMMGVLYSGNFYSILDTTSPKERAENILNTLEPICIITDNKNITKLKKLDLSCKEIFNIDEIESNLETEDIIENILQNIRNEQIDTDAAYILFTSGSTGKPKGTVVSHKAVISYTNWVEEAFKIDENTIWGSQTPFYFSMSITDVFSCIKSGGSLYIIPKMYFSFLVRLIEFLNEKKINSIYWVPSALSIVANLGALKEAKLPYLKCILFAGEVMPTKQLNMWRKKLPNVMFANLYGPTETTDICSYYILNREFKDDESIPIGINCDNCNLIILKEDGTEAKRKINGSGEYIGESDMGELLVRGSFLASGYYKDIERTQKAFIQNPINNEYPEIVYKTGDLVKYNETGELIYLGRKDFQIKHMGYRIELGEIEKAFYGINEISCAICLYDDKKDNIVLIYQGKIEEKDLAIKIKDKLLGYMLPNKYIKLEKIPYNSNGKIDRKKLKELIQ